MRSLTRAEVRDVDRRAIDDYGMSGLVLMENAGRGCVDTLCRLGCQGPVTMVCGKGNNAGDGFVIARHLDLRGVQVRVVLLGSAEELRGDAAANYAILARCDLPIVDLSRQFDVAKLTEELTGAEWIVDALVGTGATGAPRSPMDTAIRQMNQMSGLDCDTGEPAEPTFRAEHTCTFVAPKIGFANAHAAPYLGTVHVLDIGAPRRLIEGITGARPGN